jgi:hypothetical protein
MYRRDLEKRTIRRMKMVLGLKLYNSSPLSRTLLVHTLDISRSGAKVGALREHIQPGTLLAVQYKHVRASCTVVWSRTLDRGETQIGIELVGHNDDFWGLTLHDNSAGIWVSNSER